MPMGVVEGVDHVDALQSIGQQGISKKKSRRLDKQTYKRTSRINAKVDIWIVSFSFK